MSYCIDRRKRRNWALRIHPLGTLLLLAVVSVVDCKNKSSVSPKPNDCEPRANQCPPRFVCLPRRSRNGNHCVCSRYLGFRGAECRKRSQASWLLLVLTIISAFTSFRALILNIMLALEMKESGRLQANNVGRTLFLNTIATLPAITLAAAYMLILLLVPNHFVPYGRQVCLACSFLFYLMSTLSVSMVWIVDIHRLSSSLGLGRENQLAKKRKERIWRLATYIIAFSSAVLAMIFFQFDATVGQITPIIGSVYNIIVAASYHYAGRRVVRDLSVSEVNPTARHIDIAQIAENIKVTSQAMTRLTLGMSVSFIGAALTTTSPKPYYDDQNSLPRILQAQLPWFIIQQCLHGVNNLIVEYLRYGSSNRRVKPEFPVTFMSALRWSYLSTPRTTHPHLSRATVMPSVLSAGGAEGRIRIYPKEIAGTDGNHSGEKEDRDDNTNLDKDEKQEKKVDDVVDVGGGDDDNNINFPPPLLPLISSSWSSLSLVEYGGMVKKGQASYVANL